MRLIKDECGQGAAEYILVFGGVIVIAISALFIYATYFQGQTNLDSAHDLQSVRGSMK